MEALMSDTKLQTSIYKIEVGASLGDIILHIHQRNYIQQKLMDEVVNEFSLNLFYKKKPSNPKWKDFIGTITKPGEEILKGKQTWAEEFILLLSNGSSIYAVTGGSGFFAIQDFIYANFGIDVFSRLISKEDKILKATREKSFIGSILGITKYFRKNFNLFENDDFGKIYQELKADLDKDTLTTKFGFTLEDVKKDAVCVAKSSFKINKAISFEQLLKIINGCEDVLQKPSQFAINNVEKIVKKKNEDLIQKLDAELYDQLWTRYSDPNNGYPFDLCHHNYEEYLTASYYVAMKNLMLEKKSGLRNLFGDYHFEGNFTDIDILFDKIKNSKKFKNKDKFVSFIKGIKIVSYDVDGTELTHGDLFSHLLGDVSLNNKKFFFVEKEWYEIKDSFISELNNSCNYFINSNYHEGLPEKWNYQAESENQYNQKYIGKDRTIVLDKVTPENIELCDVLFWDSNNLYLCHVKAGFGNSMRDLCAQISIAANRITRDNSAAKDYAKKVYDALKEKKNNSDNYFKKIGTQTDDISDLEFISLFDKNIHFVLSVLDTADNERDIRSIEKFNSNIAKFSLRVLSREMKTLEGNISFKISQIKRPEII
jgi:uncharacterized protein (TIGR04141 family)